MADELKMENPAVESQDICACGHDHHGHDHHGHECGCGHDHDADPNEPTRCISCGAPIGEGVGHNRSMGRASFAFVGGFLIVNSYLLALLFPDEVFASELSAALGAVTLALPIVVTAIRDLIEGRVYMNELVALAILAAFAGGERREDRQRRAAFHRGADPPDAAHGPQGRRRRRDGCFRERACAGRHHQRASRREFPG